MELLLHSTKNGIKWLFLSSQMEWSLYSCRNWVVTPCLQEWSGHFISAGMEWSYSIPAGMEWPLHSCRNGMTTPFLQEWNDHSIPAGMECHSTPNLKKYASWRHILLPAAPSLARGAMSMVNRNWGPRLLEWADVAPGCVVGHRHDQLLRVHKGYPIC